LNWQKHFLPTENQTMRTLTKLAITSIIASAFAVSVSAQAPSMPITFFVTDPANALWDVTDAQPLQSPDYDVSADEDDINIRFNAGFQQDGAGKISGSGPTTVTVENSDPFIQVQNASYKVTGSITSKAGIARVTHAVVVVGTANVEGREVKVSTSRSISVNLNAALKQVSGTEKASASAAGNSAKSSGPTDVTWSEIESELGDGSWTFAMNSLTTDAKNKITGTAYVMFGRNAGARVDFAVKGVYKQKTGLSTLSLVGVGSGKGSSLKAILQGDHVTSLTGKISGQTVSVQP
jgi:hypothetical protein